MVGNKPANRQKRKELVMKKLVGAIIVSGAIVAFPLMAQEKKDMPMKEGMPMKTEEMKSGGMMMGKMKEMHGKMAEMRNEMGMMKGEETKEMGKMMGGMSGMMGDVGKMVGGGKMT